MATTPKKSLGLDTNLLLDMAGDKDFAEKSVKQDRYSKLFEDSMHYLREYMYGRVARDRARACARVPRLRKA